jgi:hypothetical protein
MLLDNFLDAVVLILLFACVALWPTQLISDGQYRLLRIAAVVLTALQLILAGPRVQLLPAYLVAGLFALLLLPRKGRSNVPSAVLEQQEGLAKKLVRWSMVVVAGLAVLASAIFCLVAPR